MSKGTLCWKCNNTCGGCSWSKSFKPVKGWTAKKTMVKDSVELIESYIVIDCPKFEPLKTYNQCASKRQDDLYNSYITHKSYFTKQEQILMRMYFEKKSSEAAKELGMSRKTLFRKVDLAKLKLKKLEERCETNQFT